MTATNWKIWQPHFDSWVQDHSEYESIEQMAVMEKYYKENLSVPSDSKAQQIAKDIDLEVKRVKLWFLNRHQSQLWVSTKLEEDPKYESQLGGPFKEAIKFATFFKKERMSNSCTLAEVAKMVGMTRANLYAFEQLQLRERTLLKRYRTLSSWMSQTPNFQVVKEKNEGLGRGRGKIDSLLTKEEVEFVDKLVKTRTRLGMNQTQLANVLGTSTGTISSFEQFNLGLKNWREWLPRLDQWVQDHRENHEER